MRSLIFIVSLMYFGGAKAQLNNPYLGFNGSYYEKVEEYAKKGDHIAQVAMGVFYMEGRGIEQDYSKALDWFEKSIKEEHDDIGRAYHRLGYIYYHGLGTDVNENVAFQFYLKAAQKEWSGSYLNLAECYELGKGTEIDYDKALSWYLRAIKEAWGKVRTKARVRCGYIYAFIKGEGSKGIEFLKAATKDDSAVAWCFLGKIYEEGIGGITKDCSEAVKCYKQSIYVERTSAALTALANLYYNGIGVEKDIETAIDLYNDAAKMGDEEAKKKLSEINRKSP